MYATVSGIYENGQVIFNEKPPTDKKMRVIVMFLDEKPEQENQLQNGVVMGSLENKGYDIPNDFNALLDDLKEYV